MKRSPLSALRSALLPGSAQGYARREAEALQAAGAVESGLPAPALGRHAVTTPAPAGLTPPGGEALPAATRLPFERSLERDFSGVRVHSSAQDAGDQSARAYTVGQHIVAPPGSLDTKTPAGRALLGHELAHTVQQLGGTPSIQRQDVRQPEGLPHTSGPGASPPDAAFTVAEGTAQEDGFILFDRNSVTLTQAARTRLQDLLRTHSEGQPSGLPVTVEIHGYASGEGTQEYNSNLSAQRAAAVQTALQSMLPARSVTRLYARGETTAFGDPPLNRRAGLRILEGVPEDIPIVRVDVPPGTLWSPSPGGWHFNLGRPGDQLRLRSFDPSLQVVPPLGAPPPSVSILAQDPHLPVNPGPPVIDWPAIIQPFSMHGVRMGERELGALHTNWAFTYNNMLRLGLNQSQAAWVANTGTAYAYNLQLSQDAPTAWDRFQREDDIYRRQYFPNEFRTPIVPIITPGSLNTITRWIFNREVDYRF